MNKLILILSVFLLFGCKKPNIDQPPTTNNLLGKWMLYKTEIYEIAGSDECMVGSSNITDSTCYITFYPPNMGNGIIGSCDTSYIFSWKRVGKQLLVNDSMYYDVRLLTKDSLVVENYYMDDILKLKNVNYYGK